VAWTPETALLALALAGSGERTDAERLLTFLDSHRTQLGSLPEKVDAEATPASVAPLAWTSALTLLTLEELGEGLPVVPGLG
jgi:glucoamylase